MRAKLVSENMQMPFRNDRNKGISEKYPLENPNYLGDSADDDKEHPKKKRKKKKFKIQENAPLFQTAFTNNLRNADNRGYRMSTRLQYEDSDKPSPDISQEEVECEVCGRPTHPGHFENGVCKHCAEQGFWVDKFGDKHNQNSRERKQQKYI